MTAVFEKWQIGSMEMRNRIVRSAIAESLCTTEGVPSERLVNLYQALGEGGAGAVITGYAYVLPDGRPAQRCLNLADDSDDPLFPALVEAVRKEGGRIVAQLVYGGSKSRLESDDPRWLDKPDAEGHRRAAVLGPSAVAHPVTGIVPQQASTNDLVDVRNAFASAARRAKRLGFDGVEVHAAHGYLLSQFLDARLNKRADGYGGPIENRARLALECVEAIRSAVGDDYPVLVKLNSSDVLGDALGAGGGLSESESLLVASWLVDAGASCIEASGDWHAVEASDVTGEPFFGSFGARLAAKLDVPVIVTGGWRDIETIERYLEATKVSGFGMARPFIRESYLPARWEAGDRRESKCTSCDFCMRYMGIPCIENRLSR